MPAEAARFAALARASRAGALVSEGMRIGHTHGFDPGPFMAHVYADRPAGRTALGRALDRRLLARRTCRRIYRVARLERAEAEPG